MSLRVWLPLDGDLKNQGISGNLIQTVAPTWVSGKIGQYAMSAGALKMDAATTASILNNQEFSFCCWVYVNADTGDTSKRAMFFGNNPMGANNNRKFSIFQYPTCNDVHLSWQNDAENVTFAGAVWSGELPSYQWTHLTITYKNPNGYMYINGILKHQFSGVSNSSSFAYETRLMESGGTFKYLNDYRIYDHCLSAAEVKEIAQGLILHYKLNDQYIESTTNLSNPNSMGGWNNSGTCVRNQNDTTLPKSPPGSKIYSVTSTSAGSMAVTMGTTIFNVPSKTLTCSIYCYLSGTQDSSTVYIRSTKTDGNIGSLEYNGSSNPTTWPKNQWIRLTKTLTTNNEATTIYFCTYINPTDCTRAFSGWQIEARNYTTPYTNSEYLSNNLNISTNNLITGLTAGGQTTISNGNTVITSGTNADTYFRLTLSTPMIKNHLYKLSCNVSGLANDGYWSFPIAGQSNTTIPIFVLKNGYNEVLFRANDTCVNAGTSVMMDDNGSTSRTVVMTANNFKLYDITPIIYDGSGFNNNGTVIGEFNMNIISPRYDKSLYLYSIDPTTNSEKGISYIQAPLSLTTPLQLSFVWWAKPESGYGDSSSHAAFCTSNQTVSPTDYNTTAFHHRDSGFDIYPSDASGVKRLNFTYTKNEWHHYAVTYDGTTARAYQDGVLKTNIEVGTNKTLASFSQLYIGFSKAGGVWRKTLGSYSDFRVYVTQLLDTDIKQLYNIGMKIDKSHNIHTYELLQEDKNKLYKTGILSNANFDEINNVFNLKYDKELYIEPDGSCWVRIFHHANCDTKLFASTDTFTTSVYKDTDRWFNVSLCNKVNKWELMVKSMPTSDGTETKYRWIQTKNPMIAVYADVTAASVTKITGNGYASYGWGGLYHIGSSTYLSTNNGTNGNWWGAVGAWANHAGGIPGWTTVITTGYEDVYLRVDNLNLENLSAKNNSSNIWTANQFIER